MSTEKYLLPNEKKDLTEETFSEAKVPFKKSSSAEMQERRMTAADKKKAMSVKKMYDADEPMAGTAGMKLKAAAKDLERKYGKGWMKMINKKNMSTEKYLLPNEKQRLDEAKITGKDILKNTKLNTAYRSHKLKGKLPESN
jgi:hypothetical protein